jgi:hypothetical protein
LNGAKKISKCPNYSETFRIIPKNGEKFLLKRGKISHKNSNSGALRLAFCGFFPNIDGIFANFVAYFNGKEQRVDFLWRRGTPRLYRLQGRGLIAVEGITLDVRAKSTIRIARADL